MLSPIHHRRTIRLVGLLLLLTGIIFLAGCAPTTFPAPFNDASCWVEDVDAYEEILVETPAEELPSYWEWDTQSTTARYYSFGCVPRSEVEDMPEEYGDAACVYAVYTYDRVCTIDNYESAGLGKPDSTCDANDGSLNAAHCGRPVALYDGSPMSIWGIDPLTGEGQEAFSVTDEQITAAGVPTGEPVLITEGVNPYTDAAIQIYRLPTGEFQLNTWYVGGKPYTIKWSPDVDGIVTLAW